MKTGFGLRGRFWTLVRKEVHRFLSVSVQTILAPLVTTLLYLLIFGQVLQADISTFADISYGQFMLPGLMMMTLMQNAFSNASSSLIQSKMHGNLDFVLLSPITAWEFTLAFVLASVVRGVMVAVGVLLLALFFFDLPVSSWWWVIGFALMSAAFMGALGLIAGVLADKFDHLSAFQNFIVMPLTFLSGVFYSIEQLPVVWQVASMFNPFFYFVDGFRYGFFAHSDVSPWMSLSVVGVFFLLTLLFSLWLVAKGVRIRK